MNAVVIIGIVVAVMLIAGVFFALVWWQMADVVFPGAAKKTGQRILGKDADAKPGPPPGATVVRFDPPSEER